MTDQCLHIAVGVVPDEAGRILISERKQDCAYAGQWEFPGGKVEPGETVEQALARELDEELGLCIRAARPLISLRHVYPDRKVFLDTWVVTDWVGQPESREGQKFDWVHPRALDTVRMLEANRPIVQAVRLPSQYLITPPCGDEAVFFAGLEGSLNSGLRLLRLRQPGMARRKYEQMALKCKQLCDQVGAELLLDHPGLSAELGLGLHLNSVDIYKYPQRPVNEGVHLAASCHNAADLSQAVSLGCDFAVLGPVAETSSHPAGKPLGWLRFQELLQTTSLPVFALGGMLPTDIQKAWQAGGQGIAAISGLWESAA